MLESKGERAQAKVCQMHMFLARSDEKATPGSSCGYGGIEQSFAYPYTNRIAPL